MDSQHKLSVGGTIGRDLLMLGPVTGSSGGNRKRTVVRMMYTSEICENVSVCIWQGFWDSYDVQNPANHVRKDECPLGEGVASAYDIDGNGNAVGEVQKDDRGSDDGVESAAQG